MSVSCGEVQREILANYSTQWNRKVYIKIDNVWNECPIEKIPASELADHYEFTESIPTDLTSDDIVSQLKKSAKNDIVGIIISDENETCCHCFVLNDDSITDAYLGDHDKETRSFDYSDFLSFMEDPTQELWNKMFNCEQFEWAGQDINLEILTSVLD